MKQLLNPAESEIVDAFHRLYWSKQLITRAHWLGYKSCQCPLDMWVFMEIIFDTRPDVVVETGTAWGGTALFLASVCERLGRGRVICVDKLNPPDTPENPHHPRHPRIQYLQGNTADPRTVQLVTHLLQPNDRVMVILDTDHHTPAMIVEMDRFGALVTPGCYLVACDSNLNGHPVEPGWGTGPWEALEQWLPRHPEFEVDREREKFLMTVHPGGFLRRKLHGKQ